MPIHISANKTERKKKGENTLCPFHRTHWCVLESMGGGRGSNGEHTGEQGDMDAAGCSCWRPKRRKREERTLLGAERRGRAAEAELRGEMNEMEELSFVTCINDGSKSRFTTNTNFMFILLS